VGEGAKVKEGDDGSLELSKKEKKEKKPGDAKKEPDPASQGGKRGSNKRGEWGAYGPNRKEYRGRGMISFHKKQKTSGRGP